MATIAEWLASLGLSEYAQSFAKNDIEADVLCELTDQDLERLGVSLGHRGSIPVLGAPRPATTAGDPSSRSARSILRHRRTAPNGVLPNGYTSTSSLGHGLCL